MAVSVVVAPIGAGKLEAWRDLQAELSGPRRGDWAQSQRRRGVTREVAFLVADPDPYVIYVIDGAEAEAAITRLSDSVHGFDRWLYDRMMEVHAGMIFADRVHDTRPGPGAWRGWRGWSSRSEKRTP